MRRSRRCWASTESPSPCSMLPASARVQRCQAACCRARCRPERVAQGCADHGQSPVRVEQIAFRFPGALRAVPLAHHGGGAIRQPEWKRGVRSEPAAYVRPPSRRPITIKAVFSCSDPAIRSLRVRARRTGPSGFLGSVGEVSVRFTRGRSKVITCRVSCSTFKGVSLERVSWQWQCKMGSRWVSADRSDHKIALVLARPEAPWKATRPWWEVMRLACEAARGSKTTARAASKVATTVFRVWGGTYFSWDPGEHYATDVGVRPLRFDCAKFLGLLNGGDQDSTVDCSDVAAIVSTFAGIIGCPLSQLAITRRSHEVRAGGRPARLEISGVRAARIRR